MGYGFIGKCNLFPGVHTEHDDARGGSSHYSLYAGGEGGATGYLGISSSGKGWAGAVVLSVRG